MTSRCKKLDDNSVLQVIQMLNSGAMQKDIAKIFGVSQAAISLIKVGKNWNQITEKFKIVAFKRPPILRKDPVKSAQRKVMMNTWVAMNARCHKPIHVSYKSYGAKGIAVCERWRFSFESFLLDMGFRPEGKTLDRIDSCGNYSPENCRWATVKEQAINRKTTIILTFDGVSKCVADWCKEKGISPQVFFHRTKKLGLSNEVALSLPASKKTRTSTMNMSIKSKE